MAAKKQKKVFAMNDSGLEDGVLDILDELAAASPEGSPPHASGLSAQVDEVVQGLSGAKTAAQVYLFDVRRLEPYPDQPFHPYSQNRLEDLAQDIRRVGVLSPILARRQGNTLQILAGHNRWQAARLAGLSEVPVLIVEADDDQAILIVTSTNLRQREKLLPSEKAFAYKLQMDALKRQGHHVDDGYSAASFITEQTGDSRMQIHRYIRLTLLLSGLLELLDRGRIAMTPAVAVSYLQAGDQQTVLTLIREFRARLSLEKANRLKALSLEALPQEIGAPRIREILVSSPNAAPAAPAAMIAYDALRPYLPRNLEPDAAEQYIIRALQSYQKITDGSIDERR